MSRCTTFGCQVSISTKVSFKITIRKRHVYFDISWPWKWNQDFYLGIWNDERTKIIFLHQFRLVTRINSQNRNETILLIKSDKFICIWILAFPIGIIKVSTPRQWIFLLYFSSLRDYRPRTILISLVHNSLGEMEWCEKRDFSFSKCEKWVSRNIKAKCVTDFLLTVSTSSMKDYTCHYEVSS